MTLKHGIIILVLFLIRYSVFGQVNYLSVDFSTFEYRHHLTNSASLVPLEKIISCSGNSIGESFHLALGRYNSISLGLGLTTINYEKQWLGIFQESNQLGAVIVKGNIKYLSLPFSINLITGTGGRSSCFRSNRHPFRFGVDITYVPSFQTGNSFSINTYGAADSSTVFSGYKPDTKEFQHAITIGLSNQFLLCNKKLKFVIEPYLGCGSGFFSSRQNSPTITYGVKLQLAIHLKLPKISIEREVNQGNYNEKKKALEQKQKEIEQQLNKP